MPKIEGPRKDQILSIACRHKRCGAGVGEACDRTRGGNPFFHQVRYNDARRIAAAEFKLADWNLRYGGKA